MADVFAPWTDPDAKPLIQFQGVTKQFGSFTAIDDLTLDIYPKEFFALLGPSGCGKTTLMRMLAGFEDPSAGSILLDGQDIAGVPPNKRATNMMFQSYALFPHLSVWDNIAFGLRRAGHDKDQIAARVEEMLRLVQLDSFARRKPHQISGGQRQRVALARALARAPKLLLLDEPLGALDKKLRQETQFELMDIQEQTSTTFVIVTHDQEEAMTVASRVAVMDHGKIVQVATPTEIYEAPNSTYVADFIGDVSFLRGTCSARPAPQEEVASKAEAPAPPPPTTQKSDPPRRPAPNALGKWLHDKVLAPVLGARDAPPKALPPPTEAERIANTPPKADLPEGGVEIAWTEGQAPIIATNGDPDLDGKDVSFAIRPEKLRVTPYKPSGPNRFKGKVIDIAYLGNISTYHVELAGGLMVKAQMANTKRDMGNAITWEDTVWISFAADAGVVLDR